MGEKFQSRREKFQNAKRAGPVADQPSRLRTPPGVGGEGWPVSLPCSRNAHPRKGLVGRAQLKTNRATLYMETRASLVGALADDWLPDQRHPLEKPSCPRGGMKPASSEGAL
jgi:hypothetical protein